MFETAAHPEQHLFAQYIDGRKILIADPSAVARSSITNILMGLGAKTHQISLASTYQEGLDQIKSGKPSLVIADFEIGKRCGLDLAPEQRIARGGDDPSRAFLIIASNTSQTAVARAAEEDVDGYIVKPYTTGTVQKVLIRTAIEKLRPAAYVNAITEGKTHIAERKLDVAENCFSHALTLNPAPTLACYYLGQVKMLSEQREDARKIYLRGLKFNQLHFKCNVGLYELLMAERQYEQAYEVIKRISQFFPANPARLAEVLRLAIVNSKYEDVETYYDIFCKLEDREEHLVRHVCAALVVCGKHYIQSGNPEQALKVFQKACATGSGRTKILREVVQAVLQYGLKSEARKFLKKFPAETHAAQDYLVSSFLLIEAEGDLEGVIRDGRALVEKDLADELVYEIMIRRSSQAGLRAATENLLARATQKYPDKREYFLEVSREFEGATVAAGAKK